MRDISEICLSASGVGNYEVKELLFGLITDTDDRVAYNALWILTHFSDEDKCWMSFKRNDLIDILLNESHSGKKRLILSLLRYMPIKEEDLRSDYLDFCLSKINSTEPYAIRAWVLKQAFEMCRYFTELIDELKCEMEMMEHVELSPGLLSAKKQVEKKIRRLKR